MVDKKTTVLSIAVGTTPPEVPVSSPSEILGNKLRNATGSKVDTSFMVIDHCHLFRLWRNRNS